MNKYYKEMNINPTDVCVIKEDVILQGNVKFKKPVYLKGNYEGNIETDSILIIDKDAVVKGKVKSKILILGGYLKGEVEALEKVEIISSGKLFGNITTKKLRIADGVIFEGTCNMIK